MEWTTIYVSSVTNAMRGKATLERQGFSVYMQRSSHVQKTDGCGYQLLVKGDAARALDVLTRAKIRVLRSESGGAQR